MKKNDLYRIIQSLIIRRKDQYKPQKPSFGQDFCRQQIKKKKLLPFNPQKKMNHLMKNFQQLETYVNVEQLCKHVNLLLKEKNYLRTQKNIEVQVQQDRKYIKQKEKPIKPIKIKLGSYYRKKYLQENDNAWKFLQNLQQNTNFNSQRKKNYSHIDLAFLSKEIDLQNVRDDEKNLQETQKLCSLFQSQNLKSSNQYQYGFSKNNKRSKTQLKYLLERKQFIYKVSTYLHMILENIHKQKWNRFSQTTPVRQYSNQSNYSNFKPSKKLASTFHSRHCSEISSENNNIFTRKEKCGSSSKQFKIKNNNMKARTVRRTIGDVKDNFTFRNRNIKQGIMKRIQQFIQIVQAQQKILKKQKNDQLNQINRLQAKYQCNYNNILRGTLSIADDQSLKQIIKKVHAQK